MKAAALSLLLLLATCTLASPKPDEYSIDVHVSAVRYLEGSQRLNVTIDGKKYELEEVAAVHTEGLLALGDYKAKLITDKHKTPYESIQTYEFLFPDKKTQKFLVVGQSE